ncbi:MAG: T9SS type A sorting domain-containing protein, partial [Bacteroidetes bacterium]|nr:T9SS type A sorting domain-containing protein [Bacteroidota bacterium]
GTSLTANGSFKDPQPLMGDNYYRLTFINIDGSREYSTVILLKRKDNMLVTAWPNPVHSTLNVELSAVTPGNYSFVLYNSMGQQVQRTVHSISQFREIVQLNATQLAAGVYHLALYDAKGTTIKKLKIEVR